MNVSYAEARNIVFPKLASAIDGLVMKTLCQRSQSQISEGAAQKTALLTEMSTFESVRNK